MKICISDDVQKPGSGNTNNGNTARTYFQEPKYAAKITGVIFHGYML